MIIGIEAQRIFRKKKHGMDIVAVELIHNLQRIDKKNQYIIFVKDDVDDGVISETENFKIVRITGGPYPYWEQFLLPCEVRRHQVQVLHCTSNTAPLQLSIPLLVTLHDIIYLEQWNFTKGTSYQILGNLYRRWNVPHIVKKAKKILTVSNYERKRIKAHFHLADDQINTVYNGVGAHFKKITDEERLREIRDKYKLPDRYVFYLGNTDPKKNMTGVMKALSILRKEKKLSFQLLMLDIERSFLDQVASEVGDKEIMKSISFTGYVPNQELPAIYSMSAAFLYPSLRESFGIPILEAMACEVPVITSNTSSMPEVAGDAAVFVDPDDAASIADGINRILNDSELQKILVEKGIQRSRAFSWEQSARQTLALYESVVSQVT